MATAVIVVIACLWAPVISGFEGVFNYIQEIWGFISSGIVAAFLVGLVLKQAPPIAAKGAMWLGVPLYALCRVPKWILDGVYGWDTLFALSLSQGGALPGGFLGALYRFNSWSFLHHMGLVFVVLAIFMVIVTYWKPLSAPVKMPVSSIDVQPHPRQYWFGGGVIAATLVLYALFW